MFQKDSLPIFAQALSPRHPCHQTSDCGEIRMAIYAERHIQLDSFMSVFPKVRGNQTHQQSSSVFPPTFHEIRSCSPVSRRTSSAFRQLRIPTHLYRPFHMG
ncbi:hypothetical protein AVEN_156828-1 [Araneus ventricosus]|uniref:Uncharacterized protein n=1 Tax=Araneus ventricosus TaxID=182803 RepID=A0A4Y2RC02_ARAVE|nr:hypothetical protein AVEN_156828-1 [Araneus ventricosus]